MPAQVSLGTSALAVVVMGVSGCGKSTLAEGLAAQLSWTMIEGDSFHCEANRARMQAGIALTDAERQGWLQALGRELQGCPAGVVLSCSALKRAYRERLRAARPGLRFVYLELDADEALARVSARGGSHFFNPSLVGSQFEALEPPKGEALVLTLAATLPMSELCQQAAAWLEPRA